MTENKDQEKQQLGFWFYPGEDPDAPGGNRLDILIKEEPTLLHFDPEKVILDVKEKGASKERLKIMHPWDFEKSYDVVPGMIEIVDRKGKKEECFTFGAKLEIECSESETKCVITSPAPILEMDRVKSMVGMFIEEVEILFAERSASLLTEHRTYQEHLIRANPLHLYIACIQSLIEKYDRLKMKGDVLIKDFSDFLHQERRRLNNNDMLPGEIPTLNQIL